MVDIYGTGSPFKGASWRVVRIGIDYDNTSGNDVFSDTRSEELAIPVNWLYIHRVDRPVTLRAGTFSFGELHPGSQIAVQIPTLFDSISVDFQVPFGEVYPVGTVVEFWVSDQPIVLGSHELVGPKIVEFDPSSPDNEFIVNTFPGLASIVAAIPTLLGNLGYSPQRSSEFNQLDGNNIAAIQAYSNPETRGTIANSDVHYRGYQRTFLPSFVASFRRDINPRYIPVVHAAAGRVVVATIWPDQAENKRIIVRMIRVQILNSAAAGSFSMMIRRINTEPTGGVVNTPGSHYPGESTVCVARHLPTGGAAEVGPILGEHLTDNQNYHEYELFRDDIADGLGGIVIDPASGGLGIFSNSSVATTLHMMLDVRWTEHPTS